MDTQQTTGDAPLAQDDAGEASKEDPTSQANDGMADGSEDVTQATSDDVVTQPASDDAKPMVGDDEAIQGKNAAVAASAAAGVVAGSSSSCRCSIG